VHIGLAPNIAGFDIFEKNFSNVLAGSGTQGERIRIEGRVIDGSGTPVRDVLVELWQANASGKYNHPADGQDKPLDPTFRGWGRACSDFKTGVWTFDTIKPGPVEGRGGRPMAPHLSLWIVARGINIGLNTRMYFSDEKDANAKDPVLNLIEWEVRRQTLIGERGSALRDGIAVYKFDIHLQGPQETVFFDI
jgi:protocatechuate 3,4-dioxygenase alpha subunit